MDGNTIAENLSRWIHVVAGILWIGLLYFFNWVNTAFVPTMDAETKKKVIPELLPRTLFWFRWGAAFTWVFGVMLLVLVYYRAPMLMFGAEGKWTALGAVMVAATFLAVFLYDFLCKTALKAPQAAFFGGWLLASGMVILFKVVGQFEARAQMIHLGAMFGTFMAFNVWFRIWPAQQKIIMAIKNGEKPDPSLPALAGTRSKHNTYMSLPLVFAMLNEHMMGGLAARAASDGWGWQDGIMPGVILVGFVGVYHLYQKAKKVPGF